MAKADHPPDRSLDRGRLYVPHHCWSGVYAPIVPQIETERYSKIGSDSVYYVRISGLAVT
jgi:hypothetical protein